MMKILRNKDIKELRSRLLMIQKGRDPLTGRQIEKPCLDHDHTSGHCRAVLDYNSNQFLGKVESARKRYLYKFEDKDIPDILRQVAHYLEQGWNFNPIHPKHTGIVLRRFGRLKVEEQNKILGKKYNHLKTKKERTKAYKQILYREENIYKLT